MKFHFILIATLFPLHAFGWGAVGHRTVGLIAQTQLTSAAKAGVERLLGSESLGDVANWADSLKSTDGYKQAVWYHFEKIPDGVSYLENLRTLPDWQQKKGGIVGAILLADRILRDPSKPIKLQSDALKFLVHFVGDIHQPLHSGRPEDKGGVTINLNWMGTPSSLHSVWDSGMISTGHRDFYSGGNALPQVSAAYCDFLLKKFAKEPVTKAFDVEGWLNESLALRAPAYDLIYNTDQPKYQSLHLPEIDLQVFTAGMRLGSMLNEIYASRPAPEKETILWNSMEAILGDVEKIISFEPNPPTPHQEIAPKYPAEWWAPVPREGAPSWEILPQDAATGEVILSKRNELGILSNFAATPFVLKGVTYASVEGFWQMTKYPEDAKDERNSNPEIKWPHTRAEVAQMTAFEAKEAGNQANAIMKKLGIEWVTFEGHRMNYLENSKGDFYRLIYSAEVEKLRQNPKVGEILQKTGNLKLRPDHVQGPNDPPAWRYFQIWMELRDNLNH